MVYRMRLPFYSMNLKRGHLFLTRLRARVTSKN